MSVSEPPDARALVKKYDLRAKKSWGQNFLVDERTYTAIIDALDLVPGDWVVEIGAGLGTLTARIADRGVQVIAIERDRDLAVILRAELGERANIEIAEDNALTYAYDQVQARAGRRPKIVGNLPYQIASPILFRLLDARSTIDHIVIMLQREMADRIVAAPATPAYGALGVMVRMAGEPRLVRRVAAGCFLPAPRVESAVLRVTPFAGGKTRVPVRDEELFSQVVHAAFGQRRKTLRNALSGLSVSPEIFAAAAIDPQRRGETLSVEEFARLTDTLYDARAAQSV